MVAERHSDRAKVPEKQDGCSCLRFSLGAVQRYRGHVPPAVGATWHCIMLGRYIPSHPGVLEAWEGFRNTVYVYQVPEY